MKNIFILLLAAGSACASVPVIDVSVLAQAIQGVTLATETLKQVNTQVERLGNPASTQAGGAGQVMASLGRLGVGQTLDDLRKVANGLNDLHYDGRGLYRPVGEVIRTADGRQFQLA